MVVTLPSTLRTTVASEGSVNPLAKTQTPASFIFSLRAPVWAYSRCTSSSLHCVASCA
ncbi:Uncharacterised protein [Mycobacteroides abscessus subsp. abscessus]|nr:Uncharacterised protein [Mycobacteroides abscessus subsp. abscessus]